MMLKENDGYPVSIPEKIRLMLAGREYETDDIGMSQAKILIFDDCVLKIAPYNKRNEETVRVMRWLDGRLPVPRVLCYDRDQERQFLLMSRVPGRMACDDYYLERPEELTARLAEALNMLWSVDISDCPRSRDIDTELKEARQRVENGRVNIANTEPETFGEGGFRDPMDLLIWLENNRPEYEPVLSHGDLCLPNILIEDGRVSGFVDLGDTGIGDRWRDIALCYRSLKKNAEGEYGEKTYPDTRPDMLFEELGISPDWDKIRYYILLDELF